MAAPEVHTQIHVQEAKPDAAELKYMKQHELPELVDTMMAFLMEKQPADPVKGLVGFLCYFKGIQPPAGVDPYTPQKK
ncbi:hypothetical protein DIPPA_15267 [Diplonema papillatum]|nr:hypothetical protein DIPPA_15267 [Diplonema papillatum]